MAQSYRAHTIRSISCFWYYWSCSPLRTTAWTFWHFWYSFSMVQIIHFKQTATRSHRWFTFMPTGSSFRRPTGVCPWPFSVLFIHNVKKSNNCYLRRQSSYMYADNTNIDIELSQPDTLKSISSLSDCLTDISVWMKSSTLKLYSDKTEFIIIGTNQQRHKLSNHFPVKLLDNDICPSDSVCNVGVVFDSDSRFHKHVSSIFKSCFYHIRDLRRIRRHIPLSTAETIWNALISSRLDYCNSLLNNIAKQDLSKLQRVQNCLARLVRHHFPCLNSYTGFQLLTESNSNCPLLHIALLQYINRLIWLVSCTFLTSPDNSVHLSHSSFLFPELNWTCASVLSLLLHASFGMNSQPHWNLVKVLPLSVNISRLISSKLLFHLKLSAAPWNGWWPMYVPGSWIWLIHLFCCASELGPNIIIIISLGTPSSSNCVDCMLWSGVLALFVWYLRQSGNIQQYEMTPHLLHQLRWSSHYHVVKSRLISAMPVIYGVLGTWYRICPLHSQAIATELALQAHTEVDMLHE